MGEAIISLSSSSQSNTDVATVVAPVADGVAVVVKDLFDIESVLVSELLLREELFAAATVLAVVAEVLPDPLPLPRPRPPLPPRVVVVGAVETSVSIGDFISTSDDSETSAFC